MQKTSPMKIISLGIIALILTTPSFSQFGMPSFKEVVSNFYTKYDYESAEKFLKFQRKKDGWYVSQVNYENPYIFSNTQLFWAKDSKSFLSLNYPLLNGDTSLLGEKVDKYLKLVDWNFDEYQYQRNRYFGYPGWDWDIIKEDTVNSKLSDTLFESNARAYSNYASGFIADQYGNFYKNNDSDRNVLKAKDHISNSRINKFINYQLKAVEAYKNILDLNPNYQTRVGNIKIKLANEYMFMFSDLQMAGDSLNAIKFAKLAQYPDSIITQSEGFLKDLPLNSILITGGDNDTYPLWYLQKVRNFRPDIIVLNINLIGLRMYLAYIEKTYNHLLFQTKDTIYLKDNFDYFLFSNPKNDSSEIEVGNFLHELIKGNNPYDTSLVFYKGYPLKKYYSKNLFFEKNKGVKSATLKINDYIFMSDFILLDIINSSGTRKIFFTYPNELVSSLLKQKEFVYELNL